jgi:hypothetical protein
MMAGMHFQIGDGWQGMAHGYAWGVYTKQTGARGDDGVYVHSMAMLMAQKPFDWGAATARHVERGAADGRARLSQAPCHG